MSNSAGSSRVGYVVKRYPRYSETFIVNEILAHEAAVRPHSPAAGSGYPTAGVAVLCVVRAAPHLPRD